MSQIFLLGALPVRCGAIVNFYKFYTVFQLEKCITPTFCVLNYLLNMLVILYKCGCGLWSIQFFAFIAATY